MDRRDFLKLGALSFASISIPTLLYPTYGEAANDKGRYSVVILGDTHFDTEPADVYHSDYNEPVEWLNAVQRKEFARNGEMWRERCPRMVERAARLVDASTRMVFQTGDLIQGDCGSGEVHRKMLDDVMNMFKDSFRGLPFVTVAGNHDVRGVDARKVYETYMPHRISSELGIDVSGTTFSFNICDDAYLVLDFSKPDDAMIEKLLDDTKGARHTFVLVHAPLFPYDSSHCRWILHGSENKSETAARLHFREEFAKRNVICLCGHTHKTEFMDWYGDGGRITQMTMNSVWSSPELASYKVSAEGAAQYGELRKKAVKTDSGKPVVDETALFDEYRPGIVSYSRANCAGSYKLKVRADRVLVDFYAGVSESPTKRFILR